MFIEGRGLTASFALPGDITQLHVNLPGAGFGMKAGNFATPRLWFGNDNAYARLDTEAGILSIGERLQSPPGGGRLPLLWLDLPQAYRERRIDTVGIRGRGSVEVSGLTIGQLCIETWADVLLAGAHIGSTCLAKTVRGNLCVNNLSAPTDTDPARTPTVELIALAGSIIVAGSNGAWRLTGRNIQSEGAAGPKHESLFSPLRRPQPV